ncbi:LysR family transcriptional regulator [Bacillaceae bacterium SIJ1]|uniref:LysR family transcriptional regulator n=1 Tax=Litoribacterium kuwaitense TaxID=1398745 RepID=UPI0013ED02E7|nr:LysR family transcriptional regulator [Litoribacterium kuwaitense]NGP45749.1 LysR family transcriptional regulator [Litoribacterium kuwaitense]
MNMDTFALFCLVVEDGSITQAAQKRYISQPAATKQIRQLENDYNTLLFHRGENKLHLTEAGKALYPFAKEMLEYYEQSKEAITMLSDTSNLLLRLGASLTIGEYILPDVLGRFRSEHETFSFNLSLGNTPDILDQLHANDIDIAFVESSFSHDPDMIIFPFAEDELILVTAKDHPWTKRSPIPIAQLKEEQFIWREPTSGTRAMIENALKEQGMFLETHRFMELGSMQSIKSAVEAGLGVSIIPRQCVTKEITFGTLQEVPIRDFTLTRKLHMVQKKRRFQKAGIAQLAAFMQKDV